MSIATAVISRLESRLPKVLDARAHGVIDYCYAAFFLSMALVCRKSNPRAATAALATGSFILVESLLTDYPLGVSKTLPFETHGRMDATFAASSFLIPKVFGFAGTPAADVFKANGLVAGAVVGMTDFSSARARAEDVEAEITA